MVESDDEAPPLGTTPYFAAMAIQLHKPPRECGFRGPGLATMVDIIDDDDAVRDSTRALLESYGYDVRDHASAEQFLRDVANKPDCLLVDQHMPGMTGLDLLEYLRAAGDRTPALMMTGRSDPSLEPRAARIGVTLLHKPVAEDKLVLWIEQARHARP